MLRSIVRGVGVCALTVVAIAPTATATATASASAPTSTSTTPRSATTAVPTPTNPIGPTSTTDRRQAWDDAVRKAGGSVDTSDASAAGGNQAAVSAAATASISVTPDTGLVRGQTVAVTGTGFGVAPVYVLQCFAGATFAFDCETSDLQASTPDSSGAVSADVTLRRLVSGPTGRVDCATAAGACEMVAGDRSGAVLARHPLAFDPNAALPATSMTVNPATGLLNDQSVTVAGTGFVPGGPVYVRACATVDPYCNGVSAFVPADAAGAFSTPLKVRLRVGGGAGNATDCLAVRCIVRAESQSNRDFTADAPITFDPNQPVPLPPVLTVTPSTGLFHDQSVTIDGAGFGASAYVNISECSSETVGFCNEYLTSAQSDAGGAFNVTTTVSRLVSTYASGGLTIVDCAMTPCSVSANSYEDEDSVPLSARARIEFDGSVPPPSAPQATATPDTDLPYRAQVAVHGTGFTPNGFVYAQFCATSAEAGSCGSSYSQGTADASGIIDLTITVKRRVGGGRFSPVLDCVDAGTECLVEVRGNRSYETVQVPMTFDPTAPIPPPPAALVVPDQNLGWRQTVGILGSGFAPGPLSIQECGEFVSGPESFESCARYGQGEANADGLLLSSFAVRRVLDFGGGFGGPTLDCATSPKPCTLQIGNGDADESASIPLGFDPNSQPPPPPVLTITPSTHLRDGQTTNVRGSGFTPGATVGLAPCASGVTLIADSCDIGRAFSAVADDTGAFSTTSAAVGVLGTARGPVDCTTAPGTCVLAGVNASDSTEFTSTPVGVDAPELRIGSTTVDEGTGMTTEAEVMLELSAPIGSPTTVAWRAIAGTANEDDYMSRSGRAVIPAGETMAMIHAVVVGDAIDEPTERFVIEVTAAAGTVIANGRATVKIRDDDAGPTVSIEDGWGHEGHGPAHADAVLSGPSARTVIVHYRTRHGSARSGSDYLRADDQIVFLPGETRKTINIELVNDPTRESVESFRVVLDDSTNASIERSTGTIGVFDDD